MTANEYQQAAMRTETRPTYKSYTPSFVRLMEGIIGLNSESGEALDILKKCMFQGHVLTEEAEHLARELGDVAWYLAITAASLGYTLDDIFQMNLDKLRSRYPDGFDPAKSQNRDVGDT